MYDSLARKLEPDEEKRHVQYYEAEDEYYDREADFAWEDDKLEHAGPPTADSRDEEY